LDLLAFLVKVISRPITDFVEGESITLTTDSLLAAQKRTKDFTMTHVTETIDLSKRNPYIPVREDKPIKLALDYLKGSIHRVGVVNDREELTGVLTQSAMARWLWKNQGNIPDWNGNQHIGNTPFRTPEMLQVHPASRALDAFTRMHRERVSALAVVNGKDKLVGGLSATDLEILLPMDLTILLKTTEEFLSLIRVAQHRPADFTVSCLPSTPLNEVIKMLIDNRVHRVYLVDEKKHPRGVVTLTDIIRAMDPT